MAKFSSRYSVRVTDVQHGSLRGAVARLHPSTTKTTRGPKRAPIQLKYDARSQTYVAPNVAPGAYRLVVSAPGLAADERVVQVGPSASPEQFVLGCKSLPHYYRGRMRVPFEPKGLVGVLLQPSVDSAALGALDALARALKLSEAPQLAPQVTRSQARLYRFSGRTSRATTSQLIGRLSALPAVRAAGLVVEARKEVMSFLASQLVVRFEASVTDAEAPAIAKRLGAAVVRKLPYVPNGWLLQTGVPASFELLDLCESLVKSGRVVYAEPNTVELVSDLAVNPTDWLAAEQWHVPIVNLPDAWETLRAENAPGVGPGDPGDLTFGSPDVVIAIIDRGIQFATVAAVTTASHPDFQGNVTSGAAKVAHFFDFSNMVPNNDAPPNNHGMGCAGVAGARAENASGIAGASYPRPAGTPRAPTSGPTRPTCPSLRSRAPRRPRTSRQFATRTTTSSCASRTSAPWPQATNSCPSCSASRDWAVYAALRTCSRPSAAETASCRRDTR